MREERGEERWKERYSFQDSLTTFDLHGSSTVVKITGIGGRIGAKRGNRRVLSDGGGVDLEEVGETHVSDEDEERKERRVEGKGLGE